MSPAARQIVAAMPAEGARLATGGDDYELLFTAAPEAADRVRETGARLGIAVAPIGRIECGSGGVRLVDRAGRQIPVETGGYRHF